MKISPQKAYINEMTKAPTKRKQFKIVIKTAIQQKGTVFAWSGDDKIFYPGALQKAFPVFLFGLFDAPSYKIGHRIMAFSESSKLPSQTSIQPDNVWRYLGTSIVGSSEIGFRYIMDVPDAVAFPVIFEANKYDVNNYVSEGDIIQQYYAKIGALEYNFYVMISGVENSLYSFMQNTAGYTYNITSFNYIATKPTFPPTVAKQFQNPLHIVKMNPVGEYITDSLNPLSYKLPTSIQDNLITIKKPILIDRYTGIYTTIEYLLDSLTLELNIQY